MTQPQHLSALADANRIRLKRCEIKKGILAGDVDPAEVIRDLPPELENMAIADLLRAQRRWGKTRARKFLNVLRITENRPLGRLTDRQINILAAALVAYRLPSYSAKRRAVIEEIAA